MPTARQLCLGIVAADVALFLIASGLNDHSNTSVDGFVWWAALGLFAVLVAIGLVIMGRFAWSRRRRSGRAGRRSGSRI